MNEMIEKIISRHAIRKFQDRQIEEEVLEQILQAGLYAPSAGNNQRGTIVVCQNKEINLELGKLNHCVMFKGRSRKAVSNTVSADQPSILDDPAITDAFYGAPTVLTIFTRPGVYSHDDAAMIAENMWLAAHFLGVGACYIGRAEETFSSEYGQKIQKEWGVPEGLVPVCHVLLGYREGPEPHAKSRKDGRIIRV